MDRRTFLKTAALGSVSFAAGCTSDPQSRLYSFVEAPMEMVTGESLWFASTCRECPAGCGLLARNRDGRIVKLEGNPLHPVNRGYLCIRGQAGLQAVYNPDRIGSPLLKKDNTWFRITHEQARNILAEKALGAAENGPDRVRMLTQIEGETLIDLFGKALSRLGSKGPLIYEPFAYESLKTANRLVFGIEGLPSYRMEDADLLLTFGADFVETWLSPVSYARQFKAMHAIREGKKGRFIHVAPYRSLTGANADLWMPCRPGTETAVALGLIRESLQNGRGRELPGPVRDSLHKVAAPFDPETVARIADLDPQHYRSACNALLESRRPLVLGTASAPPGPHALETHVACNYVNLVLDPRLTLFDFQDRHRIEAASGRAEIVDFFRRLQAEPPELLILNNVNPVFSMPDSEAMAEILSKKDLFVACIGNFWDETSMLADLIIPAALPLEAWDEYGGLRNLVSPLQPTMKSLYNAPSPGDLFLPIAYPEKAPPAEYRIYLLSRLVKKGVIPDEGEWLKTLQRGGLLLPGDSTRQDTGWKTSGSAVSLLEQVRFTGGFKTVLIAAPSIRFYDGRLANRPWVCEIQDPLTQVAWQTPVQVHPETASESDFGQGDVALIKASGKAAEAPVFISPNVRPDVVVISIGQGHETYGRYAKGIGVNPYPLLTPKLEPTSGSPLFMGEDVVLHKTGRKTDLALMSGSGLQHGRKIALSMSMEEYLAKEEKHEKHGLGMWEFPFTMPLPQGYDRERDIYPPHSHEEYRWAMVVDLDRCIGCEACAAACYAENNVAVVGLERCVEGREMAWLFIQRYYDPDHRDRTVFLPMLCQHCDNAPCEPVCPVFAPHHNKEGLNTQIYNRCIGTRFCSQNCPYKVRRFNWFEWKWPPPLNLQLNPDVTVRTKGIMEKCSFCIQRIKEAHNRAKDENREIRDGEIQPACLQACPTGVFAFGNIRDPNSRVRKLAESERAYQVMGYLNTKPAVIYLKKIT